MAIVSVTELQRREGEATRHWERVYRRSFLVITDDRNDGPQKVLGSIGLSFGDHYTSPNGEVDFFAYLNNVRYREDSEDGKQWVVDVEYGPYNPVEWPEDPLQHPADVSTDSQVFEGIVDVDVDGNPVLNTAGDPFDPPIVRDVSRSVLVVERNEATYSESIASQYRDKVNSDTFLGGDPGTVKVNAIKATRQWDKLAKFYFRVRYEFAANRDGWKRKPLNVGMRRIKSGAYSYTLASGDPITSPVPLDASGDALLPNGGAYVLEFRVYEEVSFSIFNMDNLGEVFA